MKKTIISIVTLIFITISINILCTGCGGSGGGVYELVNPTTPTIPLNPSPTLPLSTPPPPPPEIVLSSPALSHNRIFIGSPEGFLYAFDSAGHSLWNFDATASVNSSPTVSNDGSIYFGSNDRNIYSLNQQGVLRWFYPTNGAVNSSPAIDHLGRIWIGSQDGNLYSLQSDGSLHFTTHTGAAIYTNPAVYGNSAIFVGNDAGRLISYDLNGQQRYSFTSGTAAVTAGPVIDSEANAYYGTTDGRMISLDKDGNFRWSFQTGNVIYSSPAIDEQKNLFFGSDDHNLYALDQNGSELWRFDTGAIVRSSPALFSESSIIVGVTNQTILHISTQGSVINTFTTTSPIHSSPLIVNTTGVYIGHGGKEIHKIDATQINQNPASVKASQLPWSKYRGAANNPGRVECTTVNQILAKFSKFGPSNWQPDSNGQLQSRDNADFSGIYSDQPITSYSLEANLYSTYADNDSIILIAAATMDQNDLHTLSIVRSGNGLGNSLALGGKYWSMVSNHLDSSESIIATTVYADGELKNFNTEQGYWHNFLGGSTVRLTKSDTGVTAIASPLGGQAIQPLNTESQISLNWSSSPYLNRFAGPTSYGFAAHSQPFASFRNIVINGVETCAIEP